MSMQNVNHFLLILNDSILPMTVLLSVMKRVIFDTEVYRTSLSEALLSSPFAKHPYISTIVIFGMVKS